jgi:dsDNA-binding SOS-regulon protein
MKTLNEIRTFAETNDAVAFDKWCDTNSISNEWLDVTITDFNDEYYNVYLSEYGVNVMYYNGKLEEFN